MENDDGFQLVVRKKKTKGTTKRTLNKRQQYRHNIDNEEHDNIDSGPSLEYLMKRIEDCSLELKCSPFYTNFSAKLKKAITDTDHQNDLTMVCYGIGRFASCLIARYQLGLLLCLREDFQILGEKTYFYDPAFSATEMSALKSLGCALIENNEEGKRQAEKPTIFFMLHCGKPLYNNLLWANWTPRHLKNLIIIGNSFKNMHINLLDKIMEQEAGYIKKILPYTTDVPVQNSFVHGDIFNNTSIHWFPSGDLELIGTNFWDKCPEPVYEDSAEITFNKKQTNIAT